MIRNYLKIAIKVLLRRKFFTFVSLFGITFTLLVLVLVAAILEHTLLPNPTEPYRSRTLYVTFMEMYGENSSWNGEPGYGFLDRYCRDLPGVEMMTIASEDVSTVTYIGGERIELDLRHTDGAYWKVFDYTWLEGGPYTSEDDERGARVAVITDVARERLLDGESALGRTIKVGTESYEVVGVVEGVSRVLDYPYAQVWAPIGSRPDPAYRDELMSGFVALLVAGSSRDFDEIGADFAARLPLVEFRDPERYHTMSGRPLTRLELVAGQMTSLSHENAVTRALLTGAALAVGFMLLPTINLVSVSLSRIYERSSEIGVRKAFGASSSSLAGQFIFENVVLCLIGGLLAFTMAGLLLAAFNASGVLPHSDLSLNVRVFLVGLAIATLFGVLSGAYPALRMSRFHPVDALRGGAR
jgi:putative ABC transport system permease protein